MKWEPTTLARTVSSKLEDNLAHSQLNILPYVIYTFMEDQQDRNESFSKFNFASEAATKFSLNLLEALGVRAEEMRSLQQTNYFVWGCLQVQKGNLLSHDICVDKKYLTFEELLLPLVRE